MKKQGLIETQTAKYWHLDVHYVTELACLSVHPAGKVPVFASWAIGV